MEIKLIYLKLTIGEEVYVGNKLCKFIKVTRKGFNFLNLQTNRCIFYHHVYDSNWSHQNIPRHINTFKITIPCNFDNSNLVRKINQIKKE